MAGLLADAARSDYPGRAEAQTCLGVCYHAGTGVTKSADKAMEYFKKGAELGDPRAMNNLGVMYQLGIGVAVDEVKAVEWLKRGAETGHPDSMYNVGMCLQQGYARSPSGGAPLGLTRSVTRSAAASRRTSTRLCAGTRRPPTSATRAPRPGSPRWRCGPPSARVRQLTSRPRRLPQGPAAASVNADGKGSRRRSAMMEHVPQLHNEDEDEKMPEEVASATPEQAEAFYYARDFSKAYGAISGLVKRGTMTARLYSMLGAMKHYGWGTTIDEKEPAKLFGLSAALDDPFGKCARAQPLQPCI
jgi:hypothetical protein